MEIADAERITNMGLQPLCRIVGEPDLILPQSLTIIPIDSGHEGIGDALIGSIEAIRQIGEESVGRGISGAECFDYLLLQEDARRGDLYLAVDTSRLQPGEGWLPGFRHL